LFDAPQAVDFLAGRPSSRRIQNSSGADGGSKAVPSAVAETLQRNETT
jgi:hypothetical protein